MALEMIPVPSCSGDAHCGGAVLDVRPAHALLPSDSARKGLLPFRDRPSLPLPGPDIPWLLVIKVPEPGYPAVWEYGLSPFTSLPGDCAPDDIARELISLFSACVPLRVGSPAEGIFRFFLLLVFSNES